MPSFHSSPTFGTDTGWEDTVASHVSQVRTMHLCARKHTHTHTHTALQYILAKDFL